MKRVRGVKGLHRVKKELASGEIKIFVFFPRGKKLPALPGIEGSPEFMAEYYRRASELVAEKKAASAGEDKFMFLIANFKTAGEFARLPEKTRRDYLRYVKLIEEEFADLPRVALLAPDVRKKFKTFREKFSATPRKADMVWTILKRIINVAKDDGLFLAPNPCEGGGRIYEADRTEKIWTEDHLARLFAVCSKQVREAVIMALWTGQRQGLCLRMSKTAYKAGKIEVLVESKGRNPKPPKRMSIPVADVLRAMFEGLDETKATTILTNTRGQPWTEDGFRTSFAKACKLAKIGPEFGEENDLHFHDLRGTAVTRLKMADCDNALIASLTGHSLKTVDQMLDKHYLGARAKLAEQAVIKLNEWVKSGEVL